jgi:SAM-dependent methyltransferase
VTEAELERIRAEYEARDAAASSPYRWDNPGYVAYMQIVERALLKAFRDTGIRLEGARVLDVGAGSGYFLHRLQEYGAGEVHGIDLMEERVAQGRTRYPTLELRAGSATELPYGDAEFDLVTQFTCLSSILDDDVRLAVAREMRRVARGWVLSFDMRGMIVPSLPRRSPSHDSTPTIGIDEDELRRLFGEPTLLRRAALSFEIAQRTGRFPLIATALAGFSPLRSHLLAVWRVPRSNG